MSLLFKYVWFTKVCLTGWSAYKACSGESSNQIICGMSASYFLILLLATVCTTWKRAPRPQHLDALEGEYLRRLEEGIDSQINVKQA